MPEQRGNAESGAGDEERLERERREREEDELQNFERRAEWWNLHYGGASGEDAERRTREALEHAERLQSESDSKESAR
jgi:hypothetical protein